MTDQIEMPEEFTAPRGAGPQLRYAREKLGLSVGDIAARTKISQRHIDDLEAGNYAAFSSRTYAIGFARTVAKAVGLDGETIAAQVRREINALQPPARTTASYEPSDPARVPSQPLVWFSLVALGLLLAGLFFAYRTLFSPAAELPSLIEQQEAEQAAAAATPAATPAPATSGPVTFTATDERVWVSFYDADGLRLLEKELALGESFTVPTEANGPMVRTARPEALTITVGGRPVPPLAAEMMTIRDVKVDAASLLARPAPQPSAAASPMPTPTPTATRAVIDAPVRTVPLSQLQPARTSSAAAQRSPRPAASRTSAPEAPQDAAAANLASAESAAPEAAAPEAAPPPAAEPAPAAE